MKILDPGHVFQLDQLDSTPGGAPSILSFVKRVGDHYPGNHAPARPGPTTQEVLRALIARTKYVDAQIPSRHNERAVGLMREALHELELRAASERGEIDAYKETVFASILDIELMPTCSTCGHVACGRTHEPPVRRTLMTCRVCPANVEAIVGQLPEGWRRLLRVDGPDGICGNCVADPTALDDLREDYPSAEIES